MRMRRSRGHGKRDDEHVGGRDEDPCIIIFNFMRMRRSRRHGMCNGEHVGGGDEDPCMITSTVGGCAGQAAMECVMVNMLKEGTRILE